MFRQSSLFQFRHGDHTCIFYRSPKALLEVLVPYVSDGLLRGEKVFLAQKPEVIKQLLYDLMFVGIDTDQYLRSGALELHTEDEVYFVDHKFDPDGMMELLRRGIADSRRKGFSAFRTAGELSWAARGKGDCDLVIGYEKMVDEYYPGQPAIGICQYAIDDFSAEVLESVLSVHRLQLVDAPHSNHGSIRFRQDGWSAEVVADKLLVDPRYYYVVEQQQPRQVLGWGIEPNFDNATARIQSIAAAQGD